MTLEELWQLFPILLTEHNDKWNTWYDEEYKSLCSILSGIKARISHIGSTAIENIWAKPIVDILVEIPLDNDELYFRDYMNDNPMIARDYEKLKLSLWKSLEYNRDGYTNAKHDFVS